ncbi:hypothetical protein CRUP_020111, partial [Coryphaenoides rupestris]
KKGTKGTKTPKAPQSQAKKAPVVDGLDVSCIERASFLDRGPDVSYGNPLHSTALEEDLRVSEEDAKAGRKVGKKGGGGGLGKATPAAAAKRRQAASPKKMEDAGGAEKRGRKRKSDKQVAKVSQRGRTSANRKPSSSQTPSPGAKRARTRKSSSSRSADRQRKLARKPSSSDAGAAPAVARTDGQPGRLRGHRGADASVVLDRFLDICQTYKESVESTAVRRAIDNFSSTLKEQLTEMLESLIKTKGRKLLDAKYERMRAEQQLHSLQKEQAELGQRLADLRRGRSFLHGIRDLNTRYLAHRCTHPTEKEQYGASSLPALLLETRSILRAEDHLRNINNRLEARLRKKKR